MNSYTLTPTMTIILQFISINPGTQPAYRLMVHPLRPLPPPSIFQKYTQSYKHRWWRLQCSAALRKWEFQTQFELFDGPKLMSSTFRRALTMSLWEEGIIISILQVIKCWRLAVSKGPSVHTPVFCLWTEGEPVSKMDI